MPHLVDSVHGARTWTVKPISRVSAAALCDTMLAQRDESGKQVFPTGGTRVLAYSGRPQRRGRRQGRLRLFVYEPAHGQGPQPVVHQQMGEALKATVGSHLADVLANKPLGITVQIDEGHEVFDGKHSTLHPLSNNSLALRLSVRRSGWLLDGKFDETVSQIN